MIVVQGGECYGYQYDISDGFGGQGANGGDLQSAWNDDLYCIQYFANAFVRAKGMPFAVTIQEEPTISREKMLADADQLLAEFAPDYKRMAE